MPDYDEGDQSSIRPKSVWRTGAAIVGGIAAGLAFTGLMLWLISLTQ